MRKEAEEEINVDKVKERRGQVGRDESKKKG